MHPELSRYLRWEGVWTGLGNTQAGQAALVRVEFTEALQGEALGMLFEAYGDGLQVLYHGVRAYLGVAGPGMLRCAAHSTIHGPLMLDLTPDDEGVLALAGLSQAGNHISVTFMEEEEGTLMFTAFWRPQNQPSSDDMPRMHCRLKRPTPFVPPRR